MSFSLMSKIKVTNGRTTRDLIVFLLDSDQWWDELNF